MEYDDLFIWHDREVRFDVSKSQLGLRNGERVFETISNIEDTKGNNGDIGTLIFSNLRLIWYCQDNIKINLSLGYECIISTEIRTISSKVAGETQALAIKCKFNGNRFEFLFNAVANDSPNLFNSFNLIYKAYDTSRLYRDVKMKGFLTQDKNLITLPGEEVICKISGVGSVNNDGVVLGSFFMTNIRVVWFSNSLDNFNLSLPWIQIKSCKLRELNKSGKVVAVESGKGLNANIFYFKFSDKIETIIKDLENYHKKFIEQPTLGIDLSDSKVVENINKPAKKSNSENKNSQEGK
jgi:Bardet-Biedl syndrome 5 protein